MVIHTLNLWQYLRQDFPNVYEHFVDTRYIRLRLLITLQYFISTNKKYSVTFTKETLKKRGCHKLRERTLIKKFFQNEEVVKNNVMKN